MSVAMGLDTFNRRKAVVVVAISLGVALASYGELKFVFSGFIFQCLGIVFEATRLVAIQKLLQGMRMDPVSPFLFWRWERMRPLTILQFRFARFEYSSSPYTTTLLYVSFISLPLILSSDQTIPEAQFLN